MGWHRTKLMEEIAAPPYDGKADIPALAESLHMEVDDLFPVAETLQLLRFVEISEGDIALAAPGKRFVDADTDTRKSIFRDHFLTYVPIAARIKQVLDERPSHRAPASRFREELQDYMSENQATVTLATVTNWGRYAEVFAYDETSQVHSLEDLH